MLQMMIDVYNMFLIFKNDVYNVFTKNMATFKIIARFQRTDGFWPVYIRVTHNRKVKYLKTDKIVETNL